MSDLIYASLFDYKTTYDIIESQLLDLKIPDKSNSSEESESSDQSSQKPINKISNIKDVMDV